MSMFVEEEHPRGYAGKFVTADNADAGQLDLGDNLEERARQRLTATVGAGFDKVVDDGLQHCRTPGGRRLFLDTCANFSATPIVEAPKADALAALGYRTAADYAEGMQRCRSDDVLLEHGITLERARLVNTMYRQLHFDTPSRWIRESLCHADLDKLTDVRDRWGQLTGPQRYEALVGAYDPARGQRAREAAALGIHEYAHVESDIDLKVIDGLRRQAPKADTMVLAENGHTADTVKQYGTRVASAYPIDELRESGIDPAVLRGLYSDRRHRLDYYRRLADNGLRKAADVKTLQSAMGAAVTPEAMGAAIRHASPKALASFIGTNGRRPLTVADAQQVGRLAQHEITSSEQVRPWAEQVEREASRYGTPPDVSSLQVYADLADAGVTPERFGILTRAGIPPQEATRYASEPDPWAAGKPWRDTYAQREQERVQNVPQTWNPQARTWPWDERTYREGRQ